MVPDPELVNGQEADADLGLYLDFNSATPPNGPQPIRGGLGGTDPGPRTFEYEKLNPDLFAPPGTDSRDVPNAMWPLGLSHNRAGTGKEAGWARQQNAAVLPAATAMAGVDMRLAPQYVSITGHFISPVDWAQFRKQQLGIWLIATNCHYTARIAQAWAFHELMLTIIFR